MKILLCDDHTIFRNGLRRELQDAFPKIELFETDNGEQALELIKNNTIELVLLDIMLPGKDGLAVLELITFKHPRTKVLIVSQHTENVYERQAYKLGAMGYLNKMVAPLELIAAIRKILKGEKQFTNEMLESMLANKNSKNTKYDKLTDIEFRIMIELANGKSQVDIAKQMDKSPKTISVHRNNIMKKMSFKTNMDMRNYCVLHGYMSDCKPLEGKG